MKSAEAVKRLGIPESTLRKYAREYSFYLSNNPGFGRPEHHRDYSEVDLQKIRFIMQLKDERMSKESIDATLESMQADQWKRLPPLEASIQSIIPSPDNLVVLLNEKSDLQARIDELRAALEKADERVANADRRADERVAQVNADRDTLLQRLYRAETMLELYQSGKLKPD